MAMEFVEVLSFTVDFALTGSPRIIVGTYNSLCALNTHFRRLVTPHIERLPKISYGRDIYIGYHSMRGICRKRGRGSGLVLTLKAIIDSMGMASLHWNRLAVLRKGYQMEKSKQELTPI